MVNSIIFKNFLSFLQDWQFVQLGEQQNFGIKTAGLEDKATACQMLVCYARLVVAVPPGWFCLFHKTLARVRPPPDPSPGRVGGKSVCSEFTGSERITGCQPPALEMCLVLWSVSFISPVSGSNLCPGPSHRAV